MTIEELKNIIVKKYFDEMVYELEHGFKKECYKIDNEELLKKILKGNERRKYDKDNKET